ncbi:alkene reductase [Azospirillum thermophilum]|uniref:Alkene reductase n=1 Tax=Azospirillum thermophilum TaxID=2202148 RepID=A0A2S2CS78_9PROT|nr:alkene reductase [Azospirillum thermophilum]AWK87342.1 alkene reductase [Azospirillum thermophilum]
MSDSTPDSNPLFQPVTVGRMSLPNRIAMAPLTRSRTDNATGVPTAMNAEYYAQRASAGLIISEATQISPQGKGYAYTPGIHSAEQIAGWRLVTDAVHARGGHIVMQLWHVGRISHPDLQPGGALPVAPSVVKPNVKAFTVEGFKEIPEPRALAADELPGIVADYRKAARNALQAGFDGVEVHAANGYLIDQFLRDGTNKRTDAYGGPVENRARFLFEVMDAVVAEIGADRTGIRLSPLSPSNDAQESDPLSTFAPVIERLNGYGLAYLHMIEGVTRSPHPGFGGLLADLRGRWRGVYMANNSYTRELAIEAVGGGHADLVAFGRPFISNPDLVERLRRDAPLAEANGKTFYGGDARGYTDYPTLDAAE